MTDVLNDTPRINYFEQVKDNLSNIEIASLEMGAHPGAANIRNLVSETKVLLEKAKEQAADRKVISLNGEKYKRENERLLILLEGAKNAGVVLSRIIGVVAVQVGSLAVKYPNIEADAMPIVQDMADKLLQTQAIMDAAKKEANK